MLAHLTKATQDAMIGVGAAVVAGFLMGILVVIVMERASKRDAPKKPTRRRG